MGIPVQWNENGKMTLLPLYFWYLAWNSAFDIENAWPK